MTQTDWIALDASQPQALAWQMREDRAEGPGLPVGAEDLAGLAGDGGLILACGLLQGIAAPPAPRTVPAPPLPGRIAVQDWQAARLACVPGLRGEGPALMTGAETRVAGFLALNPGWDGVICLPAEETHWVHVSAGEVVSFVSALAGPLDRLAAQSAPGPWDEALFLEAMERTRSRPETLMAGLARIRAAERLGEAAPGAGRAQILGLRIGADMAAARAWWLGQPVAVIAPRDAAGPWNAAFAAQGVPAIQADAMAMTLAGLAGARARLG
ncbi:2-dehydro-3-deoxygalactonokinase [Mangrovicoccus algicola]|uniref:2-dehydro-3-deoxygalactonokinase n=1 Tax=Mangrovicoccus algicola TaxID=2771008 RepID=A0A8J6YZ63_9RHOB|nr:2-dehydro-3-deoxygalactonokinase [Mangrovicoccus algicola]MBE3638498.1 2-dehydro-3-deoxygalactonokinase [Mangrovicoccus algicola]